MAEGFNPFSSLGGMFGGTSGMILATTIGIGAIILCAGIIWFVWRLRAYNIKVDFKLPRSVKYMAENGKIDVNKVSGLVDWDRGKARYDPKTGVVWLKRPWKKGVAMKPFKIDKYLQGTNLLTVVQTGARDYMPVIPESFFIYEDEDGEQATLLHLRADTSESRAWKNTFEREAKSAYSIMGLLQQYAPILAIGLVIILWGIQFVVLRKGMCGG